MAKEDKLEYYKTYYIDRSGLPIHESDVKALTANCIPLVKTCCRLQVPKGFKFLDCTPDMSFNLSGLSCLKNPIVKKVQIPTCDGSHHKECDVVAGYEIRVVGEVNFSTSVPVSPISGYSFPNHTSTCCSKTAYVNKAISTTCCAKPCDDTEDCVDWAFAFYNICLDEDDCGMYLTINMGIALEYIDPCECDDE